MKVDLKYDTFKDIHLAEAYIFNLYSRQFIYKIGKNWGIQESYYSHQMAIS